MQEHREDPRESWRGAPALHPGSCLWIYQRAYRNLEKSTVALRDLCAGQTVPVPNRVGLSRGGIVSGGKRTRSNRPLTRRISSRSTHLPKPLCRDKTTHLRRGTISIFNSRAQSAISAACSRLLATNLRYSRVHRAMRRQKAVTTIRSIQKYCVSQIRINAYFEMLPTW